MGVIIPQVVTEDKAGGAQVIDGGLRFDSSKSQYLNRTLTTAGNRRTWTASFWFKKGKQGNWGGFFHAGDTDSQPADFIYQYSDDTWYIQSRTSGGSDEAIYQPTQVFRDTGWYHVVIAVDTTQATESERQKIYINGQRVTNFASTNGYSQDYQTEINSTTYDHRIGRTFQIGTGTNYYIDGQFTQYYFIDGQALTPSYFGYTDSLTNTWRPKKYKNTVSLPGDSGGAVGFGTNGFWLPFDGNSPIGQDQSGRGNNWTPVNFGGTNTIEKATGALPILNTDGGGKVARVGVRTDSNASSLVLALPLVGIKSDFSNAINSGTSNKAITVSGSAAASSTKSNFYGGSFVFDGTGDYLSIPDNSDFDFGSGEFTVEAWINTTTSSSRVASVIFNQSVAGATSNSAVFFGAGNTGLSLYLSTSGSSWTNYIETSSSIADGNWHHVVWQRRGNTLEIYRDGINQSDSIVASSGSSSFSGTIYNSSRDIQIGTQAGSSEYNGYIQDLRVYKGLAKYTQNFIPASTDPDILPDTPSGVAYSSNVALVPSTDGAVAFDGSGDFLSLSGSTDFDLNGVNWTVEFFMYANSTSGTQILAENRTDGSGGWSVQINSGEIEVQLSSIFDPTPANAVAANRWYHIAVVRNSGTTTLYIDGVSRGTTSTDAGSTASNGLFIGSRSGGSFSFNGFLSNFQVVKGTALYTSNFTPPTAPITSVANTKLLCCKSNSSATAADVTPGTITATNAVATNFNPFTVNINTQRGQESGYATLNPNDKPSSASVTISNGNLRATDGNSGSYSLVVSNAGLSTSITDIGYYLEVTNLKTTSGNSAYTGFSFWRVGGGAYNNLYPPGTATYNPNNGYTYSQNGGVTPWGGSTVSSQPTWQTAGDVFSVAVKGSNVWFAKNGIWISGNPATGTSPYTTIPSGYGQVFPAALALETGDQEFNFGQKPFKFPPPAGFQPLALANTPRPTIVRPDQYVGIVTYSGNGTGSSTLNSINVGFKPDLVWIKRRSTTDAGHAIYDTVRPITQRLSSSQTAIFSSEGFFESFDRSGFTVKGNSNNTNNNGDNFVAWAWKAGGNSNTYNINDVGYATTTAAGLTAGTIAPTGASINTKSGFSIIRYTGTGSAASFPHGLTQAPEFVIVKNLSDYNWAVWHSGLTSAAYYLFLNNTDGQSNSFYTFWNSTSPSNTIISLGADSSGSNLNANQNGGSHICYAWHSVPGFSKFGSYTGNSSTDGPVVITGFRPRWVLIKCSSSDQSGNAHWVLFDGERNKFNVSSNAILCNLSDREYTASDGVVGIDILSNGFKLRDNNTSRNGSGTYIYAAFAETPSFNLYGGQSNSR